MSSGLQPERVEVGRALVVDDYPMNRMTLARMLERLGHVVETAEGGRQALERVRSRPYDVVLLDILMPEVDCHQVLQRIKGDPELRDNPVIVISAVDEVGSVVKCIEMGAEDYLPKPFNPTLLEARLRTTLQRKKLRDLERSYLQQEIMLRENEKLATLGRLSAGMAHELNNPVAAARRSSQQLRTAVSRWQVTSRDLHELELTRPQAEALAILDQTAQDHSGRSGEQGTLAMSDSESEMEAWLEGLDVANPWENAHSLASLDLEQGRLSDLIARFEDTQRSAVIGWLSEITSVYRLLDDIEQGTGRVSELVGALKRYGYMDQAPIQVLNVNEDLENTIAVLRGKLGPGVAVRREFAEGLQSIQAYGSELNETWT